MEAHTTGGFLSIIIVVLISAGILVPLFNRLKVSPVLGYLAVGFIFGPFGLAALFHANPVVDYLTITDPQDVAHLAEFGIVFLMFMIGLELSPNRLWAMRKMVFGMGALQVVLSIAAVAAVAVVALGTGIAEAAVIGAALALSSTAIVMQILTDRRLIATPIGRGSFAILLFQDIAVVPILILIGLIGIGASGGVGTVLLLALGKAIVAIVGLILFGYFLLRPIFRLAGSAKGAEPFMAVTLLTVIGASNITGQAGLSMALGAFLGGLLLAETEYRHAIEVYIEPFKGLLLGLFFMTVGMGIDPSMVRVDAAWIAVCVVALIAVKALIIAGLGMLFGMSRGAAVEAGLLLGQAGEFAFVIIGTATAAGALSNDSGQFLLLVAGLSMVVTPFVALLGKRIGPWLDEMRVEAFEDETPEAIPQIQDHILICGYGRVGKAVAKILEAEGVNYLALETNAELIREHRKANVPVIYGDALHENFLEHCHMERAQAVLITMADTVVSAQIIHNIRKRWPSIPIYTRARDLKAAKVLKKNGSSVVVAETMEASLKLAASVLLGIGTDENVVDRRMELSREYAMNSMRTPD